MDEGDLSHLPFSKHISSYFSQSELKFHPKNMALLIFSRKSGPIPCPLPTFNHVPIPDYNSLPQSSLEYPNSFNFLCKVALWNELGFSFKKSANFAFVEAEESVFIILVSLIKSPAVHFTCLMLFHVFSVFPVSQYFCKVFLQVLQALLVHLTISDTHFPFLLSSTIKSFMAGGVRLLILNKKSIEQTMNDYITNELARAKWLIC